MRLVTSLEILALVLPLIVPLENLLLMFKISTMKFALGVILIVIQMYSFDPIGAEVSVSNTNSPPVLFAKDFARNETAVNVSMTKSPQFLR